MTTKELAVKKGEVVSFEGWKQTRQNFIENIQTIMVKGKDYHDLAFRGKEVRVLAKGGAEKVASAFGWKATFVKDTETHEMLGSPQGMVTYICKLSDKKDAFIGEGRGARSLKQDNNDANKTIKMAQKSAFIDAILRTSGLSDLFTQDIDEVELKDYDTSPVADDATVTVSTNEEEVVDRVCADCGNDISKPEYDYSVKFYQKPLCRNDQKNYRQ